MESYQEAEMSADTIPSESRMGAGTERRPRNSLRIFSKSLSPTHIRSPWRRIIGCT